MRIIFNREIGYGYNIRVECLKKVSHKHAFKMLRPHNIQLLKNLGLEVTAQGRKKEKNSNSSTVQHQDEVKVLSIFKENW